MKRTRATSDPRRALRRIRRPAPVPVPRQWRSEIDSLLIPAEQIAVTVRQLAKRLAADYRNRDLVVVSLLNGTVLFLADLIRHLNLPLRLDFVGISSYGNRTRPGELVFTKDLVLDVHRRNVLLVDDILDTGNTLKHVQRYLRKFKPREIRTCVLLDKPERREQQVEADYVGFEIPNEFVVGYGLDYAERFRNLPFIGILKPEVIEPTLRPGS